MGLIPLFIATLCYLWTALDLAVVQKNLPGASMFAFYAAANVSLAMSTYKPQILALLRLL